MQKYILLLSAIFLISCVPLKGKHYMPASNTGKISERNACSTRLISFNDNIEGVDISVFSAPVKFNGLKTWVWVTMKSSISFEIEFGERSVKFFTNGIELTKMDISLSKKHVDGYWESSDLEYLNEIKGSTGEIKELNFVFYLPHYEKFDLALEDLKISSKEIKNIYIAFEVFESIDIHPLNC